MCEGIHQLIIDNVEIVADAAPKMEEDHGKPFFLKCEVNGEDDEEEELPRPETVTVEQSELAEEVDLFMALNSDPLGVDPLSLEHNIEPSCKPIKEELDDESKVIVNIELSDSEAGISSAAIDRTPEVDGCRCASDVTVAKKTSPENSSLSDAHSSNNEEVANQLNEILVERESGEAKRGISAQERILKMKRKPQIDGVSVTQENVSSSAHPCCPEVESEILDRFSCSKVEVPRNQERRATRKRNVLRRPKVTSCPDFDNSITLENPIAVTRQTFTERILKTSLGFPKCNVPKERLEGEKLLALYNVKRKLQVVLTRCKEAEMLVSSLTTAGQCRRQNRNVSGIHVSPNEMEENETNCVEDLTTNTEGCEISHGVESDFVPEEESECETPVSRAETVDGNAEQGFSKANDEVSLAMSNEYVRGKSGWSVGGEYAPECALSDLKIRSRSADQKNNCLYNKETSRTLVNARVKTNESDEANKDSAENASHFLKPNNVWHINENSVCVKCLPESASEVRITPKGKGCHECSQCQESIRERADLVIQLRIRVGDSSYECSVCHKRFSQRYHLVRHMQIHSGERPYECSVCKSKFSQRGHLVRHMQIHRGERPYECSVCHKRFSQKGDLVRHTRIHSGERPYECSVCHKRFSERSNLVTHKRIHSGERPYECSVCKSKFSHRSHLVTHMCVHSGERPYKCGVCLKRFSDRSHLVKHMRIHSGDRPYECSVCKSKFSQRGHLVTHMRIHSGERPYECSVCHKRFSQKGDLVRHMRIHSGERPYECSVCHKRFSGRRNLFTHKRIHKGQRPYECSVCHKKFSRKSDLVRHIRIHSGERPYECSVCQKKFSQSNNLVAHMQIHSGKRPSEN